MASPVETLTAWRVVRPAYAASAFSGEGARLYGGRWNRVGTPVVYLSEHRSLAVLEVLTQTLGPADVAGLLLVSVTVGVDDIETAGSLPDDWNALPAPASTVAFGQAWVEEQRSLVLRVPSVVLPAESNVVLNPAHPRMATVLISPPEPVAFDPRLVR